MGKKILLALALALFIGPTTSHAVSQELEQKIIAIDTNKQKQNLAKARKLLEEKKLSKERKANYQARINKIEQNVDKIIKYQEIFKDNIRIRDQIRPHLQNRDSYFSVDVGKVTSNKKISDLFLDVAREDDYFYYGQYGSAKVDTSYNPAKSSEGKTFIEKASFDVQYRVDLETEYQVNSFVKNWVGENIDPSLTEYAKVQKIHDFIVKKNFYSKGDSQEKSGGLSIYHPASILFGNGGVCNAYATLFDLMSKEVGLNSQLVTGKSLRNGEDHMWNMVQIMGNWYHIDTTWDDPVINFSQGYVENIGDFVIYDYFLKSDVEIKKTRTINETKFRPQANSNFPTSPQNTRIEEIDGKFYVVE